MRTEPRSGSVPDGFDDLFARDPSPAVARLVMLERLYMSLLYSARIRDELERDPSALLRRFGLTAADAAHLPDPASATHRREAHGRRMLAAADIWSVFRTALLEIGVESPRALAGHALFSEYLASEEFFDPRHSLPSAFALGRGYEGKSRFFFWARPRRMELGPGFGRELFACFGRWLAVEANRSDDRELSRLAKGSFWMNEDGTPGATVVTRAAKVVGYAQGTRETMLGLGLVDLTELKP